MHLCNLIQSHHQLNKIEQKPLQDLLVTYLNKLFGPNADHLILNTMSLDILYYLVKNKVCLSESEKSII